jgi:hypothetical protein
MNTFEPQLCGICEHCGKLLYSMKDFPLNQPYGGTAFEYSKSKNMILGIGAYGSTKADYSLIYIVDPTLYNKCKETIKNKTNTNVHEELRVAFICDDCITNPDLCTIVDNEYKVISQYSDCNDLFKRSIADSLRDKNIIKEHLYQPIPEEYICLNTIKDFDKIIPTMESFYGPLLDNFWEINNTEVTITLYPVTYIENEEFKGNDNNSLEGMYFRKVLFDSGITCCNAKDETLIISSDKAYIYKLPTKVFKRLFCYKSVGE